MHEFRLIVAGGRDFNDYPLLSSVLMNFVTQGELKDHAVSIVSGMARGADRLAVQFAREHDVKLHKFPADWDRHDKAAGFIRNDKMAKFANGLLAFWDGKSRGTAHMINAARQQKLQFIHVFNYSA